MEIITGVGDRAHVTSQQFRSIIDGIIGGSYILPAAQNMEARIVSNNQISIGSGVMVHHGCVSEIKSPEKIQIVNGSQGQKRIDLIVNRYQKSGTETCKLVYIKGTPASVPQVPSYTKGNMQNGDSVDDCPLYAVELDGINIKSVTPLIFLYRKEYTKEELNIESFYTVEAFDCYRKGKEVHISFSLHTGVQVDTEHVYSITRLPIPRELRPKDVAKLHAYSCNGSWGNPREMSAFVDTDGNIKFSTPVKQAFYKFGGDWRVG